MRAVTFRAPSRVAVEGVPDPVVQRPDDVVVKVLLAGLCGSDLHVYRGRERGLDPGTPMGHEMVGEVVEVGPSVRRLKKGDRVVSPFTTSCGECYYCQHALTSRCVHGQLFGWVEQGEGLPGTQAEYARVPLAESTLVRLPSDVPLEVGLLLADVLPTGDYAAELAEVTEGGVYAVVGCGPVGLMAVLAARHRGAERIFAYDFVEERLRLARAMGATAVNVRDSGGVAALREATEGRGADGVLEVVGAAEALNLALDLVRPGGIVASVGVHTAAQLPFAPAAAYDKNLTWRTGRCPARHQIDRLLPLAREGRYPFTTVITHRWTLSQGERAYEIFDRKKDGCIKLVMTP